MKKTIFFTLITASALALLGGCDVTSNDSSGSTLNPDGSNGGGQPGDAVVRDFPIAYIQRPVPTDEDGIVAENVLEPSQSEGGAILVVRERASASASARVVTAGVFPQVPPPGEPEGEPVEPSYDVRDLSTNIDGTKLAFAMRAPLIEDADEEDQPTWNIWVYELETDTLQRVIDQDILAEAGHDRYPIFLSDDSIVFSSTRQRTSKSLLLDQSRPQYSYVTEANDESRAFTLHRIDSDFTEIEQISFGKGHDIQPTLLADGRVLFLRGDDTSNNNRDRLSLYTMNPDGSNLSLEYGFHSPSGEADNGAGPRGSLLRPKQTRDGEILVSFQPRSTRQFGGDMVMVDTENFIDIAHPTAANLGATGPAEVSISNRDVRLEEQSPGGFFNSAFPLYDGTNRLLVSWMPCAVLGYRLNVYVERLDTPIPDPDNDGEILGTVTTYLLINDEGQYVSTSGSLLADNANPVEVTFEELTALPCNADTFENPALTPAEPQYGIWVFDPEQDTLDPVVVADEIGTMFTDVVVFQARTPRPASFERPGADEFTAQLVEENVGVLHIRSIYDFDGVDTTADGIAAMADPLRTPPDTRPVRFVRFLEHANRPHEDDYEIDFGLVSGRGNQPGKAIIGYAEVHPDGSIMAKLPADVAFGMEFLDANGRRVTTGNFAPHRNWLNLRPGEVRECNGCHTPNSTEPHGRPDAEPEPANLGALAPAQFTNTLVTDPNGTPYSAQPDIGETMAEYFVRMKLADPAVTLDPLLPSVDIVYTDAWTDPASGATRGQDISMVYGAPDATGASGPDNLQTLRPVVIGDCLLTWNYLCRIVIDYEDHIQPLFETPRSFVNNQDVTEDRTCISCHSSEFVDADGNTIAQVPAPDIEGFQLDFTNAISNLDDDMIFLKGYDELFANGDPLFELDENGVLQARQVQLFIDGIPQFVLEQQTDPVSGALLFEFFDQNGQVVCRPREDEADPAFTLRLDVNNAPIPCLVPSLDEDGNPVPELIPDVQGRYLNASAGANANQNRRFFDVFAPGGAHEGYLSPAELKLFAEYLDMGGQYYNEIFKALED